MRLISSFALRSPAGLPSTDSMRSRGSPTVLLRQVTVKRHRVQRQGDPQNFQALVELAVPRLLGYLLLILDLHTELPSGLIGTVEGLLDALQSFLPP